MEGKKKMDYKEPELKDKGTNHDKYHKNEEEKRQGGPISQVDVNAGVYLNSKGVQEEGVLIPEGDVNADRFVNTEGLGVHIREEEANNHSN